MYNSSETSTRIKKLAQEKGIQMIELQKKCGLSKNTITQSGKSKEGMKAKNLYSIAELLNCSVDYLLGRVDTPNMSNRVDNSVLINGSINNNSHSTLNVATPPQDEMMQQLINGFKTLSFENKLKIMNALFELKKEN